jgi:TrmH family RNA methyltransferase
VGQNAQIDNVLDSLNKSGAAISVISDNLLASISDTVTPQGLVLICERSAVDKESFENKVSQNRSKIPLIVGLFGVNDPSNLGASLRIAEGAGARGLITTTGSADVFSPKCVRASAGSAFRVPIWAGTGGHEVIEWARQQRMTITATAANGTRSYTESDLTGERLLIFGSETHGLDKEVLEMVDECLRIEICEPVESLNLAVTAGIILFEAKRQVISRKDSN